MPTGLFEITIVLVIAAILGIIARIFKQPVILAYILTGLLIGTFGFAHLTDKPVFDILSKMGLMFLLFLIGLEINYSSLRLVGRISLVLGLAQIIFTFIIGFLIALIFNYDYLSASYISLALTFSSTIIVIKVLSEKKDTNSLYGKISVGLLLVQDFVAIVVLVFLAGIQAGEGIVFQDIFLTVIKAVVLFLIMLWLGRKILPKVFDKIAHSQELLFLSSLAWCFVIAEAVSRAGFSIEIGGFLAGLALANSSENFQISAKIRSLRDFFIVIFFVILGSSLIISNISGIIPEIIIFSLFVLIGNPIIVLIIMGFLGYRKRTSFLCGITIAQISEFSLILAALGLALGHINKEVVSLITAVGIVTIIISTYFMIYSEKIFKRFSKYLKIFERKRLKENILSDTEFHKPIILIGCHRIGRSIAYHIPKEKLLVIDFDPDVISYLRKFNYDYLFGDIANDEIFEKANFDGAKIVISTSADFEDNLTLLQRLDDLRDKGAKMKIILRAQDEKESKILYEKGVDYVLLPHFTSGQYLGKTIDIDPELKVLEQLKIKDLELIKKVEEREQN